VRSKVVTITVREKTVALTVRAVADTSEVKVPVKGLYPEGVWETSFTVDVPEGKVATFQFPAEIEVGGVGYVLSHVENGAHIGGGQVKVLADMAKAVTVYYAVKKALYEWHGTDGSHLYVWDVWYRYIPLEAEVAVLENNPSTSIAKDKDTWGYIKVRIERVSPEAGIKPWLVDRRIMYGHCTTHGHGFHGVTTFRTSGVLEGEYVWNPLCGHATMYCTFGEPGKTTHESEWTARSKETYDVVNVKAGDVLKFTANPRSVEFGVDFTFVPGESFKTVDILVAYVLDTGLVGHVSKKYQVKIEDFKGVEFVGVTYYGGRFTLLTLPKDRIRQIT